MFNSRLLNLDNYFQNERQKVLEIEFLISWNNFFLFYKIGVY